MSNFRMLTFSFLSLAIAFGADCQLALAADGDSNADGKPASLLKKSYTQMVASEFRDAIDTQIQAVKADKNNVDARRYLSYSLLQIGACEEAMDQLNILLTMIKPTAVDMLLCGEACLQAGKLKQAEQWFKKALNANPRLNCARVGLANVAAAKKKIALSEEESVGISEEQGTNEHPTTYQLGQQSGSDGAAVYTFESRGYRETQSYAGDTVRRLRNAQNNQQVASAQSSNGNLSQNLTNNQTINAWANFRGIQKR
ncbi:MAG TPA: hypothetical protein PKZ32_01270 [Candidatus Melainabacteria bacterium]|nr:hypothetical protein [Candidatus Melainabacteria bacterium]